MTYNDHQDQQDQNDVDMLRGLASCHFFYGGIDEAHALLELARAIKPDDARTVVLLARVKAHSGDLVRAANLTTKATSIMGALSPGDLAFAQLLCERLEQQTPTATLNRVKAKDLSSKHRQMAGGHAVPAVS
jgi:Flp pilus assembly protein TadD